MNGSDKVADRHRPRLELPQWVPPLVADEAKFLYDSAVTPNQTVERPVYEPEPIFTINSTGEVSRVPCREIIANSRMQAVSRTMEANALGSMTRWQIELLCRLASDERMKNVWRELYRQTRGGKQFLNPAKGIHDPQNQDTAAREFFSRAFGYAAWPAPLLRYNDFKSKRKSHITIAARLREDAHKLSSLGSDKLASDLEAIAVTCEERASAIWPVRLKPVARSRGDQVLRGYILRMTFVCQRLFGKWLPGTVATAAGVVFSKKITGHQVRNLVRAHDPDGAKPRPRA
jgi:hypothetical protein